ADADDILAAEAALVEPRRGDPDRAVVVPDREVAAGRGGHPVAVDALHGPHDLVARVDQVAGPVHRRGPPGSAVITRKPGTPINRRVGCSGTGSVLRPEVSDPPDAEPTAWCPGLHPAIRPSGASHGAVFARTGRSATAAEPAFRVLGRRREWISRW